MKKVLILKNDRIGDLFVSLGAINLILNKHLNDEVEIVLSKINTGFDFLFKKKTYVYNYSLSIKEKFLIFNLIRKKQYTDIYILSPKNFYFYLPIFFKKIKFYGICINEMNKKRPSLYLRKKLSKYVVRDRTINKDIIPNHELHKNLIEIGNLKIKNLINSNPAISETLKKIIFSEYVLFQYKEMAFKRLDWNIHDFIKLIEKFYFKTKKKLVLISDYNSTSNDFFKNKFNYYDFNINQYNYVNESNYCLYLHDISSVDMFNVIKKSDLCIVPEGMAAHISVFNKVPTLALCSLTIYSKSDFYHIIRSSKEWVPKNYYNFTLIKKDIDITLKKILSNLP